MTYGTIQKWDNSQAIGIPKKYSIRGILPAVVPVFFVAAVPSPVIIVEG